MILRQLIIFPLLCVSLFLPEVTGAQQFSPPHPLKQGIAPQNGDVQEVPVKRFNPSPGRLLAPLPASGTQEVLFLRCEFQPDTDPETTGDGLMSKNLGWFEELATRFQQYWHDNSRGRLALPVTVSSKVYRVSRTMSYYGQGRESSSRLHELFQETVNLADADIDFSKFQAYVLIHAGYGQEADIARQGVGDSPNDIWSMYLSGISITRDGTTMTSYTVVPEREDQDNHPENGVLGILLHEFGHQLGLPDLYDVDGSSSGAGDWCLMSHGAWLDDGNIPSLLCAWSRKYIGWVTPTPFSGTSASLNLSSAAETGEMTMVYTVENGASEEYFLLENRSKSGWDLHQKGEGLLIWHIDDRIGSVSGNTVNADDRHRRVDLECANGFDVNGKDDLDYRDDQHPTTSIEHPFRLSGKNRFSSWSNPASTAYDGTAGQVDVKVTSDGGNTISFALTRSTAVLSNESRISEIYLYPHPVRSGTCRFHYTIHFPPTSVEIRIYNGGGRLVNRFDSLAKSGENDFIFFPMDQAGRPLDNGTYYYKVLAQGPTESVTGRGRFTVIR